MQNNHCAVCKCKLDFAFDEGVIVTCGIICEELLEESRASLADLFPMFSNPICD